MQGDDTSREVEEERSDRRKEYQGVPQRCPPPEESKKHIYQECVGILPENVGAKDKSSGVKDCTYDRDRSIVTAMSEKGAPEREGAAHTLTNRKLLGVLNRSVTVSPDLG